MSEARMKTLRFASQPEGDERPLQEGNELYWKFCESYRWENHHTHQDFARFSETNSSESVTVWRDRNNGKLVKMTRMISPGGHTLIMTFEEIAEWPEAGFDEEKIIPF
ncbi:hypothetical protein EAJ18_12260 [Citrobacter amalonaticus]|uniref:Uncharacterized protein n=2 Tax=Enterobacteriaceae TaxID=543 RepID=A0ABY0HX40_CITAM|nr:hypothetical protein EAJ18_12260 [Citrobacter amalonaticus]